MELLTSSELLQLIPAVFPRLPQDHALAVLVDLPHSLESDNELWKKRRVIAHSWAKLLQENKEKLQLDQVQLVAYPNVGSNNADLPNTLYVIQDHLPELADGLPSAGTPISLQEVLSHTQIILAPTEFSTTAPLKIAAKQYPLRAATMPGFCEGMIPSLRLNYTEIGRRVDLLKAKLDAASGADITMLLDDREVHRLHLDLRFRTAHASTGRFPNASMVGNLPSGEAYIVPYEGEKEPSQSEGTLPVQFGSEVVTYSIKNNRAVAAYGEGEAMRKESELLAHEPAYTNLAELGLGVLADFGIHPIGEILLDEKLGLHIAFGRSDHFGGMVGTAQFTSPKAVIHIDRIYIPELQPRIKVQEVVLIYPDHHTEKIMELGKYCSIF